jgi:NAD-dependent SIR2 family protein deacetylase
MTFQNFLSGVPARDYYFQNTPYEEQIRNATEAIEEADYILIGAGAGLSAAAGLTYGGKRFTDNFQEFIEKYGITDMYSSGFYPFDSEEARWGYWSKHIYVNGIEPKALPLYKRIKEMVKDKNYFVLTTNVDHQFYKAEFGEDKIFATQGDYGLIQCMHGCHNKTYEDIEMINQMEQARKDCLIPSYMVPKCPVCGGPMNVNLRSDRYFVEDDSWHQAEKNFSKFLNKCQNKKTVLLELGVGFNTPTIIRFPFEKLTRERKNMTLIRLNLDEAIVPESLGDRAIGINADIEKSMSDIINRLSLNNKIENQEARLDYLLQKFKEDSVRYKDLKVDNNYIDKRMALRSLMNIRMPKEMAEDIIKVQDDFLTIESEEKGIVELSDIETIDKEYGSRHPFGNKISIWQGDITRLRVGAIVNAANSQLLGCFVPCHKCIDNAIHSAAGIQLRAECNNKMREKRIQFGTDYEEPTGQAMLTKGYNLPARYVIHTVGPIVENGLTNDEAAKIAVETVTSILNKHENEFDRIIFNVFKDLDREYYVDIL